MIQHRNPRVRTPAACRLQLSSMRLCQAYIERIKQVQPKINCMAEARFERALREAHEIDELVRRFRHSTASATDADANANANANAFSQAEVQRLESPLLGVPVSVKESIMVEGMVNSAGVWRRRNFRAERDATVVERVKHFGMIPLCTSNIPELTLYWADCQNTVYGRSRNPYDQSRITGASSGGEAGLIGAAGSLLGIGSDIGGSLRSPAHFCGVFAHKPSPYLVSPEGNWPPLKPARLRLFTLGPMSRYASDLRHLLRLMLIDEANSADLAQLEHSHTGRRQPPWDVAEQRGRLLRLLDEPQPFDFGRLKLLYCDYAGCNWLAALVGQRETCVQSEIRAAQQEVLEHFVNKYNCHIEQIDLNKYLKDMFEIWQALLVCGATPDREQAFEENELARLLEIKSFSWEMLKWLLGASCHTKEAILTLAVGLRVPNRRRQAYAYCDKFERLARDFKAELEGKLGENGVLVMPTLPTVAHRHNYALLRAYEARFPCLLNVMQLPATHATVRLSKKHKLPYGLTISSRPYNDHLTIAMAEEIEAAFGGWTLPAGLTSARPNSCKTRRIQANSKGATRQESCESSVKGENNK